MPRYFYDYTFWVEEITNPEIQVAVLYSYLTGVIDENYFNSIYYSPTSNNFFLR